MSRKTKKILLIVFAAVLLLIISGLIVSNQRKENREKSDSSSSKADNKAKELNPIYPIYLEQEAEQIYWQSNDILLIRINKGILKYSLNNLEGLLIIKAKNISENYIIGRCILSESVENGDVCIYTYENEVINSPEQYATVIKALKLGSDSTKEIEDIKLHETVRPIKTTSKGLLVVDNYHASPDRKYLVNIKEADKKKGYRIRELSEKEYQTLYSEVKLLSSDKIDTIIEVSENRYLFEKSNNFLYGLLSPGTKKVALISRDKELWIGELIKEYE